ncbi:MAG TPA: HDOD domain-containing protein [Burkholderiaceae bacterium]|nr:HDOD domain-containing protein [Burkholderiaceae bacterium]
MDLQTLLNQPRALPSIPEAVSHLMTELDKDDPDLRRIGTLLASDPALTTRALRLANSSFFNLQRQVGSVQEAAAIMGLNHIRTMVMAAALGGAFRQVEGVNLEQFWRYSLNVAKIAKALAQTMKQDAGAAFTAGLVHALGDLVMHMGMPDDMRRLDFSVPPLGLDRPQAELSALGYTYADVSAGFAVKWNFPEPIVNALKYLHRPFEGEVYEMLAGVLHMAVWRARAQEVGLDAAGMAATFPDMVALVMGLDLDTLLDKDPEDWTSQGELGAFID